MEAAVQALSHRLFQIVPTGFWGSEDKLHLVVDMKGTSRFPRRGRSKRQIARQPRDLPERLLETIPCRLHRFFTDQRIRFADQPRNRDPIHSRPIRSDMICGANGIEHRLTGSFVNQWPGRAHEPQNQLRTQRADVMAAQDFAGRPKTPSGPAPYEQIRKIRTSEPD